MFKTIVKAMLTTVITICALVGALFIGLFAYGYHYGYTHSNEIRAMYESGMSETEIGCVVLGIEY